MFMRHSALMILYKRFSAELDDLEVRIYDCPAVTEDALLSESGSHRLEYSSSPRYAGEKQRLKIMVEGVETEAQRIFLARHGCAAYPSFLISQPLPPDQFRE